MSSQEDGTPSSSAPLEMTDPPVGRRRKKYHKDPKNTRASNPELTSMVDNPDAILRQRRGDQRRQTSASRDSSTPAPESSENQEQGHQNPNHTPVVLPPVMPVVSLENRQGSGIVSIVSNQSASSSASQTQSSSLSQMQGEPIGSSVNAQTARALSPLEPPARPTPTEPLLFPPSLIKSTTPVSTPLAMPAIPNYRENRVVPVTHPPTTHHSRSSSFPSITTFTSLAASGPLAIQASVTAPKERTPTLQNRQEQSPRDLMVIDSPNNPATSLLVQAATDQ